MLNLLSDDFYSIPSKARGKKKGREVPITCGKDWLNLRLESCTLDNGEEYIFDYRTCEDCRQTIKQKWTRSRNSDKNSSVILVVSVPKDSMPCVSLKDKDYFNNWTRAKIREIESGRLQKNSGEEHAEDL